MKKITFCVLLLVNGLGFSQQTKTTDVVTIVNDLTVELSLNNTSQIATITIVGPSDRWFAAKLGSFTSGMQTGSDVYYYAGTTLIDGSQTGNGPVADAVQNITVLSNTVSGGLRTIVATRPFSTGDANDYTFAFSDMSIDISGAHGSSSSNALAYHGSNRSSNLNTPLTVLGVDDFTLNASKIYPNPSKGLFTVESKTALDKINVYSQTGALIKTFELADHSLDKFEVNLQGFQTGVYLLELQNTTEKTWKKILID